MGVCSQLVEGGKQRFPKEQNSKAYEVCNNLKKIESEAIQLYRKEGTPEYDQLAKAFVDRYHVQKLQVAKKEDMPANQKLVADIEFTKGFLGFLCNKLNGALKNSSQKLVQNYYEKLAKSKPVVESLIDNTYSPERHQLLKAMATSAKSHLKSIVSENFKDQSLAKKITNSYDNVEFLWMSKPAAHMYKKEGGLDVLDEYKVPVNSETTAFFNQDLDYFSEMNAVYKTSDSVGLQKNPNRVALNPAMIRMSDFNPFTVYFVLSHEMGHHMSPGIASVNGMDTRKELSGLFKCLSGRDSVRLTPKQWSEATADYFAAEVLAKELAMMPQEKRKSALKASMEFLCLANQDADGQLHQLFCREAHPANPFRASGIVGANPRLRKTIGCDGESPNYKGCAINPDNKFTGAADPKQPKTEKPAVEDEGAVH